MAIRFIDFGRQLDPSTERRFGFSHTTERIAEFEAEQDWATWDDFEAVYPAFWGQEILDRYRAACPPWVFGEPVTAEDPSLLLRGFGDHAEEHGWPEAGRLGMDAAAKVEGMQAERAEMLRLLLIAAQRTVLPGDPYVRVRHGCAFCQAEMSEEHLSSCGIGALLSKIDQG